MQIIVRREKQAQPEDWEEGKSEGIGERGRGQGTPAIALFPKSPCPFCACHVGYIARLQWHSEVFTLPLDSNEI